MLPKKRRTRQTRGEAAFAGLRTLELYGHAMRNVNPDGSITWKATGELLAEYNCDIGDVVTIEPCTFFVELDLTVYAFPPRTFANEFYVFPTRLKITTLPFVAQWPHSSSDVGVFRRPARRILCIPIRTTQLIRVTTI
jgi:hypothetical protein